MVERQGDGFSAARAARRSLALAFAPRRCCRASLALAGLVALATAACEDPARPLPPDGGGAGQARLLVESDPQGAAILLAGEATGETTPASFVGLPAGPLPIVVRLDSLGLVYSYTALPVLSANVETRVARPLSIRCTTRECVRSASQFHGAGNLRFAVNGAGPLFLYDGADLGIVWPSSTSNSYASIGSATIAARIDGEPVALGVHNVGTTRNYWAGRPIPFVVDEAAYRVSVPAWITPSVPAEVTPRGLRIVHEATVTPERPDVILIRATFRNISADSTYRALDPNGPEAGVTYTDAFLGFILNVDVGAFGEEADDLVSYSADRNLVFAYDGDFQVGGFTGGWSTRPGMVGLMLLDGPAPAVRLNAWPATHQFETGLEDAGGYALITAQQLFLPDHDDPRIGYAPSETRADYTLSVASGPLTLAPGQEATVDVAVLLAEPVPGSFESGVVLQAGDPANPSRPLAAAAAQLFALADSVAGDPPAPAGTRAE